MDSNEEKRKIIEFILSVVTENNDKYLLQMFESSMESNKTLVECISYIKSKYQKEYDLPN